MVCWLVGPKLNSTTVITLLCNLCASYELLQLLVTLDVNSNKLNDLVPDIRQLRTLEALDVSSNQFKALAKNLDYLYTLRRLNVANNQFVMGSYLIEQR